MDQQVVASLSQRRIDTYAVIAGPDMMRVSALYVWNARISATFFLPLQCAEVCFRNRVAAALCESYSSEWWRDEALLNTFSPETLETLTKTLERIEGRGQAIDSDQLTASLTFGFWVTLLKGKYNPPVWSQQLRRQFPALPKDINRELLRQLAQSVLQLRNRISHHEPLIRLDLPAKHSQVLRLLEWMCPATHGWLQPHLTFDQVDSERP